MRNRMPGNQRAGWTQRPAQDPQLRQLPCSSYPKVPGTTLISGMKTNQDVDFFQLSLAPDFSMKRGPFSRWLPITSDLLQVVIHFRKIEGLSKEECNQLLLQLTRGSNNLPTIVLIKNVVLDFKDTKSELAITFKCLFFPLQSHDYSTQTHIWEEIDRAASQWEGVCFCSRVCIVWICSFQASLP